MLYIHETFLVSKLETLKNCKKVKHTVKGGTAERGGGHCATIITFKASHADCSILREAIGTAELPDEVKEFVHDSWRVKPSRDTNRYPRAAETILHDGMNVRLVQM